MRPRHHRSSARPPAAPPDPWTEIDAAYAAERARLSALPIDELRALVEERQARHRPAPDPWADLADVAPAAPSFPAEPPATSAVPVDPAPLPHPPPPGGRPVLSRSR